MCFKTIPLNGAKCGLSTADVVLMIEDYLKLHVQEQLHRSIHVPQKP